jgi:hypothetical protein
MENVNLNDPPHRYKTEEERSRYIEAVADCGLRKLLNSYGRKSAKAARPDLYHLIQFINNPHCHAVAMGVSVDEALNQLYSELGKNVHEMYSCESLVEREKLAIAYDFQPQKVEAWQLHATLRIAILRYTREHGMVPTQTQLARFVSVTPSASPVIAEIIRCPETGDVADTSWRIDYGEDRPILQFDHSNVSKAIRDLKIESLLPRGRGERWPADIWEQR